MNRRTLFTLSALLLILFFSCRNSNIAEQPPRIKNYLHLSHTRTAANPLMDDLVETLDYTKFDMLWMGGDMLWNTTEDDATMQHLDSVLDVGNPNTLWSLGNHDDKDVTRLERYTNRPPYYSYYHNDITFIVLETQVATGNISGAQKTFFDDAIANMQPSSYLVVLHHALIYLDDDGYLDSLTVVNSTVPENNFYADVYPSLVTVQQTGTQVLCIGGDIGFVVDEFEYTTTDGIEFLASGISFATPQENKALLFTHDLTNGSLIWSFKLITDL